MSRPVAVLDANVLYPARLRDLLVRLAVSGQYQARWTVQILDECFRSIVADRPDLSIERLERTRQLLSTAVPDAVVEDCDHLVDGVDLPDRDDRHVLAAAIAAHADTLVTANVRDFPESAVPSGIAVQSPDEFVFGLAQQDLDAVLAVIEQQAAALRNPPMTVSELLDGLQVVGLRESVDALRRSAL